MSRKRNSKKPECTIAKELHKTWLKNKRKKDPEKIMQLIVERNEAEGKKIPGSKPTVEKALLYGYCLDDGLRDIITEYFLNREQTEQDQASTLKNI